MEISDSKSGTVVHCPSQKHPTTWRGSEETTEGHPSTIRVLKLLGRGNRYSSNVYSKDFYPRCSLKGQVVLVLLLLVGNSGDDTKVS